jgi:hypothetical protein
VARRAKRQTHRAVVRVHDPVLRHAEVTVAARLFHTVDRAAGRREDLDDESRCLLDTTAGDAITRVRHEEQVGTQELTFDEE